MFCHRAGDIGKLLIKFDLIDLMEVRELIVQNQFQRYNPDGSGILVNLDRLIRYDQIDVMDLLDGFLVAIFFEDLI